MLTVAIDCGGSFIKSAVLDSAGTIHGTENRLKTPYPLTPQMFIEILSAIVEHHETQLFTSTDRVSVGMPGMIRHGVVIHTPHYINSAGPFTPRDSELTNLWRSFDMQSGLIAALKKPVLVMNDADVHGAGVINGTGLEVVFTLGTGLGSSVFDGGKLAPHLELSHAFVRSGVTYDQWIGEAQRKVIGNTLWNRRVRLLIEKWQPVFLWDRVYIGGGNSQQISPHTASKLGSNVVIVANVAGLYGGNAIWNLSQHG